MHALAALLGVPAADFDTGVLLHRTRPVLDKTQGFAFGKSIDGSYVAFDKPPASQTVARTDEELQAVRAAGVTRLHRAFPQVSSICTAVD